MGAHYPLKEQSKGFLDLEKFRDYCQKCQKRKFLMKDFKIKSYNFMNATPVAETLEATGDLQAAPTDKELQPTVEAASVPTTTQAQEIVETPKECGPCAV